MAEHPTVRPRRSVLYIPGSNRRALEKGRNLPADGLILDLEDAVAPDIKEMARTTIREALEARSAYGGRELVVRVNGLDTAWGHDDLTSMATTSADAILLPKIESADLVRRSCAILDAAGAADDLPIWCMMETPRGILQAEAVADHPRVECLVMGTSDLATDLLAQHTPMRLPMLVSLGTCLLAARAAGIAVLDGVYLDLDDEAGFAASCRQGRELGFDGKTLIHPKQLAAANEAFGPSAEEIARAHVIIAAFEEAQAAGKGLVVVGGKLVENLHVAEAKRLIALQHSIMAREPGR
ncbi:MAG: CoA ester lyase [Gammaproteobacteria bacterium]|nr:CoA ester lyase [Gammaproteobacteria bacterium]